MICSNSTFLPLILLHNRTVKSMWSLATSSCLALSFTLHLFIPLFFSSSSVSLYSLFTLSRTVTLVLSIHFMLLLPWLFVQLFTPIFILLQCFAYLSPIRENVARRCFRFLLLHFVISRLICHFLRTSSTSV